MVDSPRGAIARHPVLLPLLALLGWGCALPSIATLDANALTFSLASLAGIYGTHFMALALLGLVPTAIAAILWFIATRAGMLLPPRARLAQAISGAIFLLIFFYALRVVVLAWGVRHDFSVPLWIWLALSASAALLIVRYAPGLLDNLVGFSVFLALVGIVCIPFAFIDVDETPPPVQSVQTKVRPDILLVTLDALSARQMSLYGAEQATTPNIDHLAEQALVFERAYSGGNFTTSGIATLLTGQYPDVHRAVHLGARALPQYRAASLPAILKTAGYRTTYVSTNSYAAPWRSGYGRYFDSGVGDATNWRRSFCEDELAKWLPYNCQLNNPFLNLVVSRAAGAGENNLQFDGRLVVAGAQRILRDASSDGRPLFLWTHILPPHDPYAAPSPCLGHFYGGSEHRTAATSQPIYGARTPATSLRTVRLLEQRYRESLWCADRTVGEIVQAFRARSRPFIVIITADHGESFTEKLLAHGGPYLNEDVIRIPLVIFMSATRAGRRSSVIASQADVLPIVASILRGADAKDVEALVSARRKREPALAMEFIDNPRLARLRRGGIAAIGQQGKYIRYLSPLPAPFTGLTEETLGKASADSEEGRLLRRVIANRLSAYAGQVGDEVSH